MFLVRILSCFVFGFYVMEYGDKVRWNGLFGFIGINVDFILCFLYFYVYNCNKCLFIFLL